MKGALEMRVWRELGFDDGEPRAWRAQVYRNREEPVSAVGVGVSADEAADDCLTRFKELERRLAEAEATIEWRPLR